jgi:putative endonuclease
MFFYTYVWFSLKDKKMYTGYTFNLDLRLVQHNKGNVVSTKDRRPLKLIYYEACLNQSNALKREKYLKTTYGKRYLKNRINFEEIITQG